MRRSSLRRVPFADQAKNLVGHCLYIKVIGIDQVGVRRGAERRHRALAVQAIPTGQGSLRIVQVKRARVT